MTELNCDSYLSILGDIIDACNDSTTTKLNLETLINSLVSTDALIESDISTMAIPATMTHLNKYIIVQNIRLTKLRFQQALYNLVDVRNENLLNQAINQTTTQEEQNAYALETIEIKKYVETVVDSCTCMSGRKYVVNKCSH
jgi:hypothetical protein